MHYLCSPFKSLFSCTEELVPFDSLLCYGIIAVSIPGGISVMYS